MRARLRRLGHHRIDGRGIQPQLGALVQDAGGLAVRIALDATARWIGRLAVDAGRPSAAAVGRDDVLADAADEDGVVWR